MLSVNVHYAAKFQKKCDKILIENARKDWSTICLHKFPIYWVLYE